MRIVVSVLLAVCLFMPAAGAQDEVIDKPPPLAPDVCTFVAQRVGAQEWWPDYAHGVNDARVVWLRFGDFAGTGRFRDDYLLRFGQFDIDGDGHPDRVWPIDRQGGQVEGGGANIALSHSGSQEAEAALIPKHAMVEDAENRLPFGKHFYQIGFADTEGAYVSEVRYWDGTGSHLACAFENEMVDSYWLNAEPLEGGFSDLPLAVNLIGVRGDLGAHGLPAPLTPGETMPESVKGNVYPQLQALGFTDDGIGEWQIDASSVWDVDFDNDGHKDRLLRLGLVRNDGPGGSYFLLMNGNRLDMTRRQKAFIKLQRDRRYFDARESWVSVDGRIYLERKGPLWHDLLLILPQNSGRALEAHLHVIPKIIYKNPPAD